MCKITLSVGDSKENSAQGAYSTDLAWGPQLLSKVDKVLSVILSRVKLDAKTRANLEVTIKNELALLLEDVLKHGARILRPKLNEFKCLSTNKVVKFKLAVN